MIKQYFIDKWFTLSVAESLTSWYLQALCSSESWSSGFFLGWITTYNLDQKVALLRIDRNHAQSCDCVSGRVAREMASWCLWLFGSHIAVATTWYAEPYAEQWVNIPFAHYSIMQQSTNNWGDHIILDEGIINKSWLNRQQMQQFVAQTVYEKLPAIVAGL